MSKFPEMLAYLRTKEDISQAELAKRLGLTPGAIGNYESGKRRPKQDTLEAIADYFNVDYNTLFMGLSDIVGCTAEEVRLIELYRSASDRDRILVKQILQFYDEQFMAEEDAIAEREGYK